MTSIKNKIKRINPVKYSDIVELILNNKCNTECLFCQASDFYGETNFNKIKRDLIKARADKTRIVQLTGGEPTISPYFINTIKFTKELGINSIRVATNAIKFADKIFLENCRNSGLSGFNIAVQSHLEAVHDRIVNKRGAFKKTICGIENILDLYDTNCVTTNTIINNLNYDHLPEIVDFLHKKGIRKIFLTFVMPFGEAYKNFDLIIPNYPEVSEKIKISLNKINKMTEEVISIDNYPLCFLKENEFQASHLNLTQYPDNTFYKCPYGKKCIYGPLCKGINNNYIKKRGWDEFVPVRQQLINSKVNLKINRGLIPVLISDIFNSKYGVHLRFMNKKLSVLKEEGNKIVKYIDGKKDIETIFKDYKFNDISKRFLGSLYVRGFIDFKNGKPGVNNDISGEIRLKENIFEYETYLNTFRNYPTVNIVN
jgi:cyclic pyranopterin phosphate synthase